MKPLLETSLEWTPFPEELLDQIREILEEEAQSVMTHSAISLEGRIFPEEVHFRAGLKRNGEITQHNFESAKLVPEGKDKINSAIDDCVGCSRQILQEYIEDEDTRFDLPREWKKLGNELYFQYSTVNTDLEAEADRLLGMTESDGLVRKVFDQNEPLDIAYRVDDPDTLSEVYKKFKSKEKLATDETDSSGEETTH